MRHHTLAALLLLALTGLLAAAEPSITQREEIPIRFTSDLTDIATVILWVTDTGGATWEEAGRQEVADDATGQPVVRFRPQRDGRYGFAFKRIWRDGKEEPRPMTGELPKPGHAVIIDRTAPVIERFEVTGDASDPLLITVRWRVGDANPATTPVQLAMAPRAGGDWIRFDAPQPASGSWTGAFPTATHRLRLEAVDRAGNRSASEPWTAPEPEPEPTTATATATPAAESEGDSGEPPTSEPGPTDPELDEAIAELPDPDTLEQEVPTGPQPTFVDSPPQPREGGGEGEAAAVASAPAGDASDPSAPAAPPPAAVQPMTLDELVPLPAIPAPQPAVTNPDAVLAGLGRVVVGDAAAQALAAARSAVAKDNIPTARALYQRLGDSPLAAVARLEEALLLARTGREAMAIALVETAPADARSDALHALHARLLLRQEAWDAARRAVAAISAQGPHAREALWLGSLARRGLGEGERAEPVLRHLATGGDQWAVLARELLRRGG